MLHIILLALSVTTILLFFIFIYRPYIKLLHRDTRAIAGMLSQLPAEVDVEGHVRAVVRGMETTPAIVSMAGNQSGVTGGLDPAAQEYWASGAPMAAGTASGGFMDGSRPVWMGHAGGLLPMVGQSSPGYRPSAGMYDQRESMQNTHQVAGHDSTVYKDG